MTERLKLPHRSGNRAADRRGSRPAPPGPVEEPTILGFPAEIVEETGPADIPADIPPDTRPTRVPASRSAPADSPSHPALTVVRRPEAFGAGALVLAGVAASVRSDVLEPLVVVLCGGLLVLLGFLLLVPARAHRLVGLVALVVSLAATEIGRASCRERV